MAEKEKKKKRRRTRAEIDTTNELYEFIYKEYNLSSLPNYMFVKISQVFTGEYGKNVREPISVFDLYDMWQRKMDYLNRQAEYNKEHGKEMTGTQRVTYDLAILINKYDSYKRWKDKQNAIHEQEKTFAEQTKRMKAISVVKPVQIQTPNETDISDIIDEI